MPSFSPEEIITRDRHRILLGAVGPRPIALVSTLDEYGTPNLSPFSFFNIFSSNPPTLIFSPARRVRDNTTKDTLHNALREQEVVVNVVNYDLVQQVNLSSAEYPSDVDEFVKSGLTPVPSDLVAPPRVAESPVSLECVVKNVVALGDEGGAGNLVICEIKKIHCADYVMSDEGGLDQEALDLVGRMGKSWWVRASGDALFTVGAPQVGIGVDQIPMVIRNSTVLTGNNLGLLAGVTFLPTEEEIQQKKNDFDIRRLLQNYADGIERREALHEVARELLENGQVHEAWKVLLIDKSAR
ncbi:MAG TPA: flavin reductase [Cryomorphaceae bacterium]|nr:flavin reductase [Cryomorphaceae bacterium]|tara:strand:+ start:2671 stop:3564 length:894 start_codon:yes stop_codon:yes gene_type:complete